MLYVTVAVDDELREVPFDEFSDNSSFLLFEVLPKRMCLIAINLYFREHLEFDIILVDELANFFLGSWFLFTELVARKSKNFKALCSVSLIESYKLFVALVG